MTEITINDKTLSINIECDDKEDFDAILQHLINRGLPP